MRACPRILFWTWKLCSRRMSSEFRSAQVIISGSVLKFPHYKVNVGGDVFSIITQKLLTPQGDQNSYPYVGLTTESSKNRNIYLHRLVASTFLPHPICMKMIVHHLNGDRTDCRASNLKQVTSSENSMMRHIFPGRKVEQVNLVSGDLVKTWNRITDAANALCIAGENISKVCRKKQQSAGGFLQRYPEIEDLPGEQWIPVISTKFGIYFPLYSISTHGRVKKISDSRLLRPYLDSSGYYQVRLTRNFNTQSFRVHKLMAIVFLLHDYSETRRFVDHIDNHRRNNNLLNLRWVSQAENIKYYHSSQKHLNHSINWIS